MMKDVDRSVELVICGSSAVTLPSYMQWDREVLQYVGGLVDYISLHRYVDNRAGDTADFLAVTNSIDKQIEEMDAVCRFVQAKRRSRKRAYLCFDEWNVWYKNMQMDGAGKHAPHLIEERYNLEDALVVAGFFNSFIRHADVVKIANIAQVVNVIAPVQTRGEELLLQSIFHVFEMYTKRRKGACRFGQPIQGPTYEGATHGRVYTDRRERHRGWRSAPRLRHQPQPRCRGSLCGSFSPIARSHRSWMPRSSRATTRRPRTRSKIRM